MVHFALDDDSHIDTLTAYLAVDFTDEELAEFKREFAAGACLPFSPLIHLKIVHAPEDYIGKGFEYIRQKEDDAGRKEEPFCLINKEAKKRGGIWYIGDFFCEDAVEEEVAASTRVVERILCTPRALAIAAVNYDIANMSVEEDLVNCEMEQPMTNESHQPLVLGDEESADEYVGDIAEDRDVEVTAEPGEFETSDDAELCSNMMPRPDMVARLKPDVAREHGLRSDWTWMQDADPVWLEDGTEKTFPNGSVVIHCRFDPDYPWGEAKWPKGSL